VGSLDQAGTGGISNGAWRVRMLIAAIVRRGIGKWLLVRESQPTLMVARGLVWLSALLFATCGSNALAYDWLQFNGNPQHSGNNTLEVLLGPANVNQLAVKYQVPLPAPADGVPVYLEAVTTVGGVRDLLFVMTRAGDILALDAKTGATVWSKSYPNPYPLSACLSGNPRCATTSSPAVDPNRQYVYSYGLEGKVHKFQVGDGTEVITGGWPQLTTNKPFVEKASSALAIATSAGTSYLYATNSGFYGDAGDYQGHVTVINLATGAQNVFNMLCSDQTVHFVNTPSTPDCGSRGAGVWARPGVIYDASTDRIFMATGNQFNAALNNWGESVVALNPNGTGAGGKPLDSYTPTDQAALDLEDIDLGSTAPAILPVPLNSNIQHLAVQGGKDGRLRLINLANLSGAGGPGNLGGEIGAIINVPQGNEVLTQPSVWVNPGDGSTWVFVVNDSGSSALRLVIDGGGNPSLAPQWHNALGGASPLVANNVLYFASKSSGLLRALDPRTGGVLFSSTQIHTVHWQSPVVANCGLYIINGDVNSSGQLTAFSLPGILLAQPIKLAVTSVNGGSNATMGVGFNVVVQAQDCNDTPQNVTADTGVTLSLGNGTGSLRGTLSCTITTGSNSCTVSGTTYSQGDTGVIVTAARTSGNVLSPGSSAPFVVVGKTQTVVEFFDPDLNNFFITADPTEQSFVDSGAVGRWQRTGITFSAGGPSQVCRFYGNGAINPATGTIFGPNSHFYTANAAECAGLKAQFSPAAKSWKFESNDFLTTPVVNGACPSGLVPVYRAYNNGFASGIDSNHRITSNFAAYQQTVAAGWIGEGIVMCAPPNSTAGATRWSSSSSRT
jgi:PQQ-like domain